MTRDNDAPTLMRRPWGGIVNKIFQTKLDPRQIQVLREKVMADEEARSKREQEKASSIEEVNPKLKNIQPDNYEPPRTMEELIYRAKRGTVTFAVRSFREGSVNGKTLHTQISQAPLCKGLSSSMRTFAVRIFQEPIFAGATSWAIQFFQTAPSLKPTSPLSKLQVISPVPYSSPRMSALPDAILRRPIWAMRWASSLMIAM